MRNEVRASYSENRIGGNARPHPPSRAEANPVILSRIATAGEGPALSPRRERPELCARLAPLNQPTAPPPPPPPPPPGGGGPQGGGGGGGWGGGGTRRPRDFHPP